MDTVIINPQKTKKTKETSVNSELKNLKFEVQMLRSFLVSFIGKDKEGKYNAKFVKEMLEVAKEIPTYSFHGGKSFLSELKQI